MANETRASTNQNIENLDGDGTDEDADEAFDGPTTSSRAILGNRIEYTDILPENTVVVSGSVRGGGRGEGQ